MNAAANSPVALLCAVALASPALAADSDGASAAGQGQPAGKADKIVCKRVEGGESVGSLLSKSICMTRSQWTAREQANRDNRDRIMDEYNRTPIQPLLPAPPASGGPN